MKYLKYGVPTLMVIASVILLMYPISKTDSENLTTIGNASTDKGYSSTPIYPNGGYEGVELEAPGADVNREIEISAQEILDADTDGLIGTNAPFNIRFITEDDVKESINRILVNNNFKANLFGSEYLPYVVTLRHAEMTDFVSERDSEVTKVAKEYEDKIAKDLQQVIGNSTGN